MRGVGSDEAIPEEGSVMLSSMFSRIRELTLPKYQRQSARAARRECENAKLPPRVPQRCRRRVTRGTPAAFTRNGGDSSGRQKPVRAMRV
jgi:hypothetical protein